MQITLHSCKVVIHRKRRFYEFAECINQWYSPNDFHSRISLIENCEKESRAAPTGMQIALQRRK